MFRWRSIPFARVPMIELEDEDGIPFVKLSGEFDLANIASVESALATVGQQTIVVDLTAVTFLDSTILNVLVRKHKSSNGQLIVVLPLDSPVRRVFDVTNLTDYLRTVTGRDDAANAARAGSA